MCIFLSIQYWQAAEKQGKVPSGQMFLWRPWHRPKVHDKGTRMETVHTDVAEVRI